MRIQDILNKVNDVGFEEVVQSFGNLPNRINIALQDIPQRMEGVVYNVTKEVMLELQSELKDIAISVSKIKGLTLVNIELQKKLDEMRGQSARGNFLEDNPALNAYMKLIEQAENVLEVSYKTAQEIINNLFPFIMEEMSINLFMTPKSFIWKSPTSFVNKVPVMSDSLESFNMNLVMPIMKPLIEKARITESDYSLPPIAFKSKVILLQGLQKAINVMNILGSIVLKWLEDPLPQYKNLSIMNINFMTWSIKEFGPFGSKFFGFPF